MVTTKTDTPVDKEQEVQKSPKALPSNEAIGDLPKPASDIQTTSGADRSLVVDERIIPDSNLPTEYVEGILDIAQEGSGLLRPPFSSKDDRNVYISSSQIRRFNLRSGDIVGGQARLPKENERYWGLLKVEKVNGEDSVENGERVKFEDLTPIHPDQAIKLETTSDKLTTRIVDLVSPIGFGQRGLVVSPPKAGKTKIG